MTATIHFFIGKGGVGKSTTSALTAIRLAGSGRQTLLVSMDPAHNQKDIFKCRFSEKPKQVMARLAVKEVDAEYWIKRYLEDIRLDLRRGYRYQSAFNVETYYDILKYSPGLEEYALLLAFEDVLNAAGQIQDILFDMPPTALTLRFFSLPSITLIWLEELLKLRSRIQRKKDIVSKIKRGKKTVERDRVQNRLTALIERHKRLLQHIRTNQTAVHLVMNNDQLSFLEAVRIRDRLDEIGIGIERVVVNKMKDEDVLQDLKLSFNNYPIDLFPYSSAKMVGIEALKTYIQKHALYANGVNVEKGHHLN